LKTCASFVRKLVKKEFVRFSSFFVHRQLAKNTEHQKQKSCFEFKLQAQLSTGKRLFY